MAYAGYVKVDFGQLEWENDRLVGVALRGTRPHYVNVGRYDQSAYEFFHNDPEFIPEIRALLENSPHYNLIYINPDLSLFIHEGQK